MSLSLSAASPSPLAVGGGLPKSVVPVSANSVSEQSGSLGWDRNHHAGCSSNFSGMDGFVTSASSGSSDGTFHSDAGSECSDFGKSVEEMCKRSLDHFPHTDLSFPTPLLDFDFRIAVKLRPESSTVQGRTAANTPAPKEIIAISSGQWSGSFGNGRVVAGGYDLGQARGFRPIRIVEGAFVLQTSDEVPAILELRTRGSLSGPCDVLDTLLSPTQPKEIDSRRYGFRMFSTIKTADKRYAEYVNCALWIASGVWHNDELIIDAYRVT